MATYHARDLENSQVDAEGFMNDSVQIWKTIGELIVRWICAMREKLIS